MKTVPHNEYKRTLKLLLDIYPSKGALSKELEVSYDYIYQIQREKRNIKRSVYERMVDLYSKCQELNLDKDNIDSLSFTKDLKTITNNSKDLILKTNKSLEKKLAIGEFYEITNLVLSRTLAKTEFYEKPIVGKVVKQYKSFYLVDNGKYKVTVLKNDLYTSNLQIKKIQGEKNGKNGKSRVRY